MPSNLFILDNDEDFAQRAGTIAGNEGFEVHLATSVASGRELLAETRMDLMIIAETLPDGSGLELMATIDLARHGRFAVVTLDPSLDGARRAVAASAVDYLIKPLQLADMLRLLSRSNRRLALPGYRPSSANLAGLISRSAAMRPIVDSIKSVAARGVSVLITGESGAGKENAARALHALSNRPGAFVALHCATIRDEQHANLIFGHEPVVGNGAGQNNRGVFEQAEHGTLYLDEITEMPLSLQAYLLRALDEMGSLRAGRSASSVPVRIIAGATGDPLEAVKTGRLRQDLYYRLADIPINLPPLRNRGGDLVLLASTFIERLNLQSGQSKTLSADAEGWLQRHSWPGNVRELKSAVEREYLTGGGDVIYLRQIEPEEPRWTKEDVLLSLPLGATLEEMERRVIQRALAHFKNDKTATARSLGVSVRTIHNHLARWNHQVKAAKR